jgi:Fe-S cluster assembly iron-binding protein IscA
MTIEVTPQARQQLNKLLENSDKKSIRLFIRGYG